MPVIVTFLAAAVGNILGYTVFKDVVVGMYYNSYSLPAYVTIWNPDAFVKTTWKEYVSDGNAVLAAPENYITLR